MTKVRKLVRKVGAPLPERIEDVEKISRLDQYKMLFFQPYRS
jgi:hypothetical protein